MDLSLTTEQEQLRDTARRFLREEITVERIVAEANDDAPLDRGTWTALGELGWLAMATPAAAGGLGASATDVAVLMEELGRGPVPGPVFTSAVLVPALLAALDDPELSRTALAPLLAGATAATVVLPCRAGFPVAPGTAAVEARAGARGVTLSGQARFVPAARAASHVLVLAPGDAGAPLFACWVALDRPGVQVRLLPGFAPRQYAVRFDDVVVDPSASVALDGPGEARLADAVLRTVPLLCSYQVGSCAAVFEMTVAYSRERVQFGRTIGSFQRVQDHVIGLANAMDSARWATAFALSKLDGDPTVTPGEAIHVAKSATAEGHAAACHAAHEVHAGIGSDVSYPLAVHTHASRTLFAYLGDPAWHRARLAVLLGFGPGSRTGASTGGRP